MSDTPYSAVSCQMHSELELAIMHGQSIEVTLKEECLIIKPYDVMTRKGAGEFLLAHGQNGEKIEIRLDKIRSWNNVN